MVVILDPNAHLLFWPMSLSGLAGQEPVDVKEVAVSPSHVVMHRPPQGRALEVQLEGPLPLQEVLPPLVV